MDITKLKKKIDSENARMNGDLEYTFKYKGYTSKIVRVAVYGHLCGYIKLNSNVSDREYEVIDKVAHGGMTWIDNQWVCFNYFHTGDFSLWGYEKSRCSKKDVYRDFDYVKENIKSVIDVLEENYK